MREDEEGEATGPGEYEAPEDIGTSQTWHVVSETMLYRMLERVQHGEDPQVVMAMAMTTSVGEVVPEYREMVGRVWDHWPSRREKQALRHRLVRLAYPGLGELLDQIANTVARHMRRQRRAIEEQR